MSDLTAYAANVKDNLEALDARANSFARGNYNLAKEIWEL